MDRASHRPPDYDPADEIEPDFDDLND